MMVIVIMVVMMAIMIMIMIVVVVVVVCMNVICYVLGRLFLGDRCGFSRLKFTLSSPIHFPQRNTMLLSGGGTVGELRLKPCPLAGRTGHLAGDRTIQGLNAADFTRQNTASNLMFPNAERAGLFE